MSTRPPSTRRRGGQPGNTNALKHGLTARIYHPPAAPPQTQNAIPDPVSSPPDPEPAPVTVPLTYDEETELLRALFATLVNRYPDTGQFVEVFPLFRRLVNMIFYQASTLRALHPLTAEDYAGLAANLDQILRLIVIPKPIGFLFVPQERMLPA